MDFGKRLPAVVGLVRDRRMINYLHGIPVRIETIKTAGAVAVGAQLLHDSDPLRLKKPVPVIDLIDVFYNKTDVIQALLFVRGGIYRGTMQREIILAAG